MTFRGHNQALRTGVTKGPVPQRELLSILRVLIDTSRARAASRTRDEARKALRALLAEANWQTAFVLRNLGAKRCRYLSGLGYPVSSEYSARSDIGRLNQWGGRDG